MCWDCFCIQMSKHEEKKMMLESSGLSMEKAEKKERSSKCKDKSLRDKGLTEEEKEQRKERKLGRKRVGIVPIFYFIFFFYF